MMIMISTVMMVIQSLKAQEQLEVESASMKWSRHKKHQRRVGSQRRSHAKRVTLIGRKSGKCGGSASYGERGEDIDDLRESMVDLRLTIQRLILLKLEKEKEHTDMVAALEREKNWLDDSAVLLRAENEELRGEICELKTTLATIRNILLGNHASDGFYEPLHPSTKTSIDNDSYNCAFLLKPNVAPSNQAMPTLQSPIFGAPLMSSL